MEELLFRIGWTKAEASRRFKVSPNTIARWIKNGAPESVMLYLRLLVRNMNV